MADKFVDNETFKKMSMEEKADYIRRYTAENSGVPKFFFTCRRCPKCSTLWEVEAKECSFCGSELGGERRSDDE